MPASTRRSMAADAGPLQPVTDNVAPPLTPGKVVKQLTAENEALQKSVATLTDALAGLTVAKDKADADGAAAGGVAAPPAGKKGGKKDKSAPAPAKTAYRFYCDAHPKKEAGVDMRKVWKEASPEIKNSYEAMAQADKARFAREQEEQKALEMLYDKKKQDAALEFYQAHLDAKAALEKAGAEKKKGKKKAKDPEAPKRPMSSYMYFVADVRESVVKKNPKAQPKDIMKTLGEMWGQLEKGKAGKKGTKRYDDSAAEDKARYEMEKKAYDAVVAERTKQAEAEQLARQNQDKKEALALLKGRQAAAGTATGAGTGTIYIPATDPSALDDMSVVSAITSAPKPRKKKDPNAPKKNLTAYIFFTKENRGPIQAQAGLANNQNRELLAEVGRQWRELAPEKREKYEKMAAEDKERYAKEMEQYNASKK